VKKENRVLTIVLLKQLWLAGGVYLAIGYTLFFIAYLLPESPAWVVGLIEQLKPTVKALKTAVRVNEHPFPAQVVIAYCAFGSIVLTAYVTYCFFFVETVRLWLTQKYFERINIWSRSKLFFAGLFGFVCAFLFFPMSLFINDPINIGWRTIWFFSPSFGSVTFLLITSSLPVIFFPVGMMHFHLLYLKIQNHYRSQS